jgi:hypothetical protein
MPALQIDRLLRNLQQSSEEFGKKATLLSSFIEKVQKQLQGLPGKAVAEVVEKDRQLSFNRSTGGEWHLWFRGPDDKDLQSLTSMSIEKKLMAIELLPRLLVSIQKAQDSQAKRIEAALAELPITITPNSAGKSEGK